MVTSIRITVLLTPRRVLAHCEVGALRIPDLRITCPFSVRGGRHNRAELLSRRCRVVAVGDSERHMPVRLLFLCQSQPAEGIGETRRHLVARLSLVDPRVRRPRKMITISRLPDHGREAEVIEYPAEDTGLERNRR